MKTYLTGHHWRSTKCPARRDLADAAARGDVTATQRARLSRATIHRQLVREAQALIVTL